MNKPLERQRLATKYLRKLDRAKRSARLHNVLICDLLSFFHLNLLMMMITSTIAINV